MKKILIFILALTIMLNADITWQGFRGAVFSIPAECYIGGGDLDDYWKIYVSSNVPTMQSIGNSDMTFDVLNTGAHSTFTIHNSDATYEANLIVEGTVGSGDITISDATPVLNFKDTDAAAGDVNASIQADATDTGDGTEDIDVTMQQQVAGIATTFLNADADGTLDLGTTAQNTDVKGDLIVTGADATIAVAGVKLTAADGVLTILGLGDGNDENLTFDFDNAAANEVNVASGTGVTGIDFGTIDLKTDYVWAQTFDTDVAAAAVTLSAATLAADGTDTDIPILITPKGAGRVKISTEVELANQSAIDATVATDYTSIYPYDDGSNVHIAALIDDNATESTEYLASTQDVLNAGVGTSLWFDGVNDYVSANGLAALATSFTEYSLEMRYRHKSVSGVGQVIMNFANSASNNTAGSVYINGSGQLSVLLRQDDNTKNIDAYYATALTDGQIYYIVFVGTESSNALYINGRAITLTYNDGNATTDATMQSGFTINRFGFGYWGRLSLTDYCYGELYSGRVHNKALDATDAVDLAIIEGGAVPEKYQGASQTENLAETDFATHAKWDVTGDFVDTGGNATYTWSVAQTSTLTQTAANLAVAGVGQKKYRFEYDLTETVAFNGDGAITITTGYASTAKTIPLTAGTNLSVEFESKAAPTDFVIQIISGTDTQGTYVFDNVSLTQIGLIDAWLPENITSDYWYAQYGNDGTHNATPVNTPVSGLITNQEADATAGGLVFEKSRSGGVITTADVVGSIIGKANDGTDFHTGVGKIDFVSSGTIGSNRTPGGIDFYYATDAAPSVLTKGLTLSNAGVFDVAAAFTAGTIASDAGITTGKDGTDGIITIYSEQGATDYSFTINPHATMTSAANFYFPADEPAGTYLLNMTSGGIMGYDATDYQEEDATIDALAGLTIQDVSIIEGTGADAFNVVASGGNNYMLGSNAGNTALEFKTPANVLSQIGGAPLASPTFTTQITTPKVINSGNVGAANTGVTAVEYGDGYRHTTVLTVSQADALTTADLASIADGYLLYTFPAGVIVIDYAYMSMGMTATTEQLGDTPDVGLGTVIGTGAVATLDGTGTFENIITGQTAVADGTAEVKTALPTANVPFIIESGDARTIHFNVADAWADDTSTDLTADIAGTVVIVWSFLQ